MTTAEENKQLVRRTSKIWEGDVSAVDELFAPSFVNRAPMLPDARGAPGGSSGRSRRCGRRSVTSGSRPRT